MNRPFGWDGTGLPTGAPGVPVTVPSTSMIWTVRLGPVLPRRRGRRTLGKGDTGEDVDLRGGGTLRADLFEDPFFFDLNGFRNGLQFTGDDFFAGLNVTAIVVEVPSDLFGSDNIGVWCTTTESKGRDSPFRSRSRSRASPPKPMSWPQSPKTGGLLSWRSSFGGPIC